MEDRDAHGCPAGDYGEHHFTYSLFPHTGGWYNGTQAEAYALNDRPLAWLSQQAGKDHPGKEEKFIAEDGSFVSTSSPNVIIETIKQEEDGQGLILLLYESQRKRGPIEINFGRPVKSAWTTNLLEEKIEKLEVSACQV